MTVDPTNANQVKLAYDYVCDRLAGYYGSSLYAAAWERHDKRLRAYYCREPKTGTKWRSKLRMATFWLACQAYHARFVDAHRTDPFVFVKASDDSVRDQDAQEKAKLAHVDLNYDLRRSGFKERLLRNMYPHVERFGTAVAREYFRTRQEPIQQRNVVLDQYGRPAGVQEQTEYRRIEYTCTQPIHPLNFAHDMTRSDFWSSQWGSVRFELPLSELFLMRDNPEFYQPGVRDVMERAIKGETGWSTGHTAFYSEHGDDDNRSHVIIVDEYYGPLWIDGNETDITLYHVLISKAHQQVLQIRPSLFAKIPYWKIQAHPDPEGPYGVGPCDMLLPISAWEDKTINMYNDYMAAAAKYLWKVNPSNITGGLTMLINGLPGGVVPIENDDSGRAWQQALEPLRTNMGTIPPIADIMGLVERYKQTSGPSSNARGKESSQLQDTATGISLMAQREDMMAASVQASIDEGIKNGMWIKVDAMTRFFQEPRVAEIQRGDMPMLVEHYPYELGSVSGYTFEIKRQTSDIEAGKNMSFLKLIMGLQQILPFPPDVLVDVVESVGIAMGIDGVDAKFAKVRESIREKVPGDLAAPGGGAAGALPVPGAGQEVPGAGAGPITQGANSGNLAAALA